MKLPYRQEVARGDGEAVRRLVRTTGFFSPEEEAIASELVEERLCRGEESGYLFLFAEKKDRLLGYACFGPIPGTLNSYDFYWIAVAPDTQGKGIGKGLLAAAERIMLGRGACRVYADTSSRPQYEPTRAFYRACGYIPEATLVDFYSPGDGKVIFSKFLCLEEENAK